jgi:hypothetical protein
MGSVYFVNSAHKWDWGLGLGLVNSKHSKDLCQAF